MDNFQIPKLITPEIIESVLSNEEALKKLFHLEDEEGSIHGDSCQVTWNSKLIKLLLCDVQIYVKSGGCEERHNSDSNFNTQGKVHINVSDLLNKKNIEAQEKEIEKIKESIAQINNEIESIKSTLNGIKMF